MPNKLEHVFQDCVGLVRKGSSIKECLELYPNHSIELEPMLEATFATGEQFGTPMPAMSRSHIRSTIFDAWDKRHAPRRRPWHIAIQLPRLVAASAMVLIVVALSGTGAVMASQDAAPGTTLYPVRTFYEDARLSLSFSKEERIKLYTAYISKSASEFFVANAMGQAHLDVERMEGQVQDLNTLSQKISIDEPSMAGEITTSVLEALKPVESTIGTTIESAPKNSYPCLEHSLKLISYGYGRVNASLEATEIEIPNGRSPSLNTEGLCSP